MAGLHAVGNSRPKMGWTRSVRVRCITFPDDPSAHCSIPPQSTSRRMRQLTHNATPYHPQLPVHCLHRCAPPPTILRGLPWQCSAIPFVCAVVCFQSAISVRQGALGIKPLCVDFDPGCALKGWGHQPRRMAQPSKIPLHPTACARTPLLQYGLGPRMARPSGHASSTEGANIVPQHVVKPADGRLLVARFVFPNARPRPSLLLCGGPSTSHPHTPTRSTTLCK